MDIQTAEFGLTKEELELAEILYPFALREMRAVKQLGTKFAYYTTAATAISILQNQEVWLRNITEMNDFAEIEYGVECLLSALKLNKPRFATLFDTKFPGFTDELVTMFNDRLPQLKKALYICCVSKHASTEDDFGRLSMWRAYGGNAGVSLIFKPDKFLNSNQKFGAFSSPVAYLSHAEMGNHLAEILDNIEANQNIIGNFERNRLAVALNHVFEMAVLSTKHPGFKEEQEWRIFYRPTLDDNHGAEYSLETIGGIPQGIYKLKLRNSPEEGVFGFTIAENLCQVIIGPTDHDFVIREALATSLRKLGIENSNKMIVESNIPMRVAY